jgi:uncharacterized protein YqeY
MNLKTRIEDDMKTALRAKDRARLESIRMLRAAIQRREVDERTELDDPGVLSVIQKLIKQSQDAVTQFQAGNRQDLVEKEQHNIDILKAYLPAPLDASDLEALVRAAITEADATNIRDMGQVMGILKSKLQGRADMATVSQIVKSLLQG